MLDIKKYVMSVMPLDLEAPPFGIFIGSTEVVEIDEDGNEASIGGIPAYVRFKDIIDKSEQEILQELVDRVYQHIYLEVPDNTRVYLYYIDNKRYLLNNEYRPELYY